MKTIGIGLLFLFSVFSGLYIADFQHQKLKNSKKLLEAMIKVKMLLRYSRTDKHKVLRTIDYDYFNECNIKGKLDSELFKTAQNYFDEMGSRDFNSEVEALNSAITTIESKMDLVINKCNQNRKLYISLGILIGTFLVIIFI